MWEWSWNQRYRPSDTGQIQIDGLEDMQQTFRAVEHFQSKDRNTSIYKLQTLSQHNTVRIWHVLVRDIDYYSTPIALRPVNANASLVDLMNLQLFPKMSSEVRFAVYGIRATDAKELAAGPARALLPPDIGLIRNADQIILDFTSRPFDPVEFNRMISVVNQVEAVL